MINSATILNVGAHKDYRKQQNETAVFGGFVF